MFDMVNSLESAFLQITILEIVMIKLLDRKLDYDFIRKTTSAEDQKDYKCAIFVWYNIKL